LRGASDELYSKSKMKHATWQSVWTKQRRLHVAGYRLRALSTFFEPFTNSKRQLIVILLTASFTVAGQPVISPYNNVKLTDRHIERIEKLKTPAKKLKKYHRFYSRDSIKLVRDIDRYWKRKSDSLTKVALAKNEMLEDKKESFVDAITDPIARLRVTGLITEDMYRLPPELEFQYSDALLEAIYSGCRYYLVECAKDTAGTFNLRSKVPDQLSAKAGELNARAAIPGLPSMSETTNKFKSQVTGLVNEKLGENELLQHGLELKGDASKYAAQAKEYAKYGDMTPDELGQVAMARLESESQRRLLAKTDLAEMQTQMNQVNELKAMQSDYKNQMNALSDSAARRELARQKAEELAIDYLEKNPQILQSAQKKMSLLMMKYSFLASSNDLSTGVKRTSLQGRAFRERIVAAANFQLLAIEPVTIDFSPQLGFKFNTRFAVGAGGMYRQTFTSAVPAFAPDVFGYKGFASYDVANSFFAYGEYARNSPGVIILEDHTRRIWKPAALLGVGRKVSIHKSIDMTALALYNILWKPGDPVYPRPFMVRVGFQLSEVALLKRKPEVKL